MNVFAKIFGQIFDSSISTDYLVRHIFMDLLVLADRDGVVDMTLDAIARRTNVPEDIVTNAIKKLMEPDEQSRSNQENGRRLIPLDSRRNWGWQIVNYEHYRQIRDEESRRTYFRNKKREYRTTQRETESNLSTMSTMSTPSPTLSWTVQDIPTLSTEGTRCLEMSTDLEGEREREVYIGETGGLAPRPPIEKDVSSYKDSSYTEKELKQSAVDVVRAAIDETMAVINKWSFEDLVDIARAELKERTLDQVRDSMTCRCFIAKNVSDGIGASDDKLFINLVKQAKFQLQKGISTEEIAEGMISQWKQFRRAGEQNLLKPTTREMSFVRFFSDQSIWTSSKHWGFLKAKGTKDIVEI